MKRFLILVLTVTSFVACSRDEYSDNPDSLDMEYIEGVTNAGDLHNEYLQGLFNAMSNYSTTLCTRAGELTESTFLTEMAKIQLAVLDGTDISKMSRNQVVSHIQTNIEVTVAPEVISMAQTIVDYPQMSIIPTLETNGTLSTAMKGYVQEVDNILLSTTMSDAMKESKLRLAYLNWYRAGDENDRKLISSTYDIFIDSKNYWEQNAAQWERAYGLKTTIKSYLWSIARSDGWALAKAVYHAGWYYATMFWKEMLIASGTASAVTAIFGLIKEISMSNIDGEIIYTIGDSSLSESELKTRIIEEMIVLRPELENLIE